VDEFETRTEIDTKGDTYFVLLNRIHYKFTRRGDCAEIMKYEQTMKINKVGIQQKGEITAQ
jgi:hypothetical protein